MAPKSKSKLVTEIIYSISETTLHCSEEIVLSIYPHCVLPKHYFELALLRLQRREQMLQNRTGSDSSASLAKAARHM